MATYQLKFELIPVIWAENNCYDARGLYEGELYDLAEVWDANQIKENIIILISELLPKSISWNSNLEIWGNPDSNDIQIWYNEKKEVESITVRLDLRKDLSDLLTKIVILAKKIHCVFFFPSCREIVDPDNEKLKLKLKLKLVINNSYAAKWVHNPNEYMDKMKKKDFE